MLGTLDPVELCEDEVEGTRQLITEVSHIPSSVDHRIESENTYFFHRKVTIAWGGALFTLTALTYSCRNCMPISAVATAQEFDWDKSETGLVLSSFYWGYITTQILSGFLSDRYGGDQVITLAAIAWGPLTIAFPFCAYVFEDKSSQLTFLVINRVIFGIVTGFHYPALSSITASKVEKENRTFFYTAIGAGTTAGNVISGRLGSYLLDRFSWHVSFYVFGAIATFWAIAMRIVLMRKRCLHPCTKVTSTRAEVPTTRKTWAVLLKHRAFWALIVQFTCNSYSWYLTLSWLPTFFEETFPGAKGWVFNVLPWTFVVFVDFISGYIADRLMKGGLSTTTTRKLLQTIASLSNVAALIFVGRTQCYLTALLLMTYALTINAVGAAGAYANPQDLVPAQAGAVYGVMNAFGSIPGFVGVYVSGFILEYFESWSAVFTVTSAILFVGWSVFMIFGTGKQLL
ncbi:voltage-gated purine nucleotide uniporter SLC17A9-like [Ptychodera flava]|uniref:voltage-gated purine nucleotide uniporter SLC17A9-like n=1 Tax=Ptychodera flava TaxID=63121 RepID=UPI00396A6529